MISTRRLAFTLSAVAACTWALTGCKVSVETLEQHLGDRETKSLTWESGMDLILKGDLRNVEVVRGDSAEEIVVTYRAVVDLYSDRTQTQVNRTLDELSFKFPSNDDAVEVSASRSSDSNVGAILVVAVPSEFDGKIWIEQNKENGGGEFELEYTGNATQVEVDLNSLLTDFNIKSPAKLRTVLANVNGGDISTGTFSADDLEQVGLFTGNGSVDASFGTIPSKDVKLGSDFGGDVLIGLPASGDYTARVMGDVIDVGGVPSGCSKDERDDETRVVCGEGTDTYKFLAESNDIASVSGFFKPIE